MFYKLQFPDIQLGAEKNLASDQADLQRYALTTAANPAAIQIRQQKLESREAYLNFVAALVEELENEITRARQAGYDEGRHAEYLVNHPYKYMGNKEQRRIANRIERDELWKDHT